jgi:hypothetical protein
VDMSEACRHRMEEDFGVQATVSGSKMEKPSESQDGGALVLSKYPGGRALKILSLPKSS